MKKVVNVSNITNLGLILIIGILYLLFNLFYFQLLGGVTLQNTIYQSILALSVIGTLTALYLFYKGFDAKKISVIVLFLYFLNDAKGVISALIISIKKGPQIVDSITQAGGTEDVINKISLSILEIQIYTAIEVLILAAFLVFCIYLLATPKKISTKKILIMLGIATLIMYLIGVFDQYFFNKLIGMYASFNFSLAPLIKLVKYFVLIYLVCGYRGGRVANLIYYLVLLTFSIVGIVPLMQTYWSYAQTAGASGYALFGHLLMPVIALLYGVIISAFLAFKNQEKIK